jgi:RecJ-like exonuclease
MSDDKRQPCPTCTGRGYIGDNYQYCGACYGTGRKDAPPPKDQRMADLAWSRRVTIAARANQQLPKD